ncbi:Integral membrane protein SED5 [Savitreella phatthalungensis]
MLDRTAEFRSCVAVAHKSAPRTNKANKATNTPSNGPRKASEFFSYAQSISHDIDRTSQKLQRLAQLCQKKGIFDDHTTAIQELTYVIKQDLAKITDDVKTLQGMSAKNSQKSRGSGQQAAHVDSVVGSLNKGVNTATKNFKDILEVRTRNMRESKMRTDNFVHSAGGSHLSRAAQLRDNPLYNGGNASTLTQRASSAPPTSPNGIDDGARFEYLSLGEENSTSQADNPYAKGVTGEQQQALMMHDASDQYLESRSSAIETIESTIAELGGIFQQLAQMVSEQRETVQRIDANTDDVVLNVDRAQYEITKYWKRVSGNRILMLKIFGILILFFLLFVMLR